RQAGPLEHIFRYRNGGRQVQRRCSAFLGGRRGAVGLAARPAQDQHRDSAEIPAGRQEAGVPVHVRRRVLNRKEITLKYIYPIFAALMLAWGTTAGIAAVEAADLKIGFIDAERINRESAPAERASKQLEKEFQPRAQELQRREVQIKTLQGQLEKESVTMSESDRRSREQELSR